MIPTLKPCVIQIPGECHRCGKRFGAGARCWNLVNYGLFCRPCAERWASIYNPAAMRERA